MSAAYALWTLDRRGAPELVGTMPALTTARGCWGALGVALIVAGGRVVDTRGDVARSQVDLVLAAARDRAASPASEPRIERDVAAIEDSEPAAAAAIEDTEPATEVVAEAAAPSPLPDVVAPAPTCIARDCDEAPATTYPVGHPRRCDPLLVDLCRRHRATAMTRRTLAGGGDLAAIVRSLVTGVRGQRAAAAPPYVAPDVAPKRRGRPPRTEAAVAIDPLAELRAAGLRLAAHRELLDAADGLAPDDRAMVLALARRLAKGRAR